MKVGLIVHPQGAREVYLEGATTRETQLSRESQGPRAVMNALERLAGSYESQAKAAGQELAIAQAQLKDHQARLGISLSRLFEPPPQSNHSRKGPRDLEARQPSRRSRLASGSGPGFLPPSR